MGVVTSTHLYNILWAANTYSRSPDPAAEINNYLIANAQLTPNIREDSGQPEGWRDYQQMLSELGLIFSTRLIRPITLTPLGLAYLDGSMSFSEIMTLQALRFQYPNGHHTQMSPALKNAIVGTQFDLARTAAELEYHTGVMIRPAVLAWRILRRLVQRNSASEISVNEFESYVMRCSKNTEFTVCTDAIIRARTHGLNLPERGGRPRRNSQDWIKFLNKTTIFSATDDREPVLSLSAFGTQHAQEIDAMCTALENPATFWQPGTISKADRVRWYAEFGGVDLSVPELPKTEAEAKVEKTEFVIGEEEEDEPVPENLPGGGRVQPRPFRGIAQNNARSRNSGNLTIQSVYSAELTRTAHRLHDQMVMLIAETCQAKGAIVFDDPDSVDLLVQHQQQEFIVEVKSIQPRNFIARLRYALGQVLHYDFLRSGDSQLPRRKVIAVTANVPRDSWTVEFLIHHLDMDLLTLESGQLRTFTTSDASLELFA